MDFRFSEEQQELRDSARGFLASQADPAQVRAAMQTTLGYDVGLWRQIAEELGWPSLHIPEAHGGLGLGHVDLAILLETTGEALLCAPLFSTVVLAANTILALGNEAQRARWLPGIAAGTCTATLAFTEAAGRWDAKDIETTATPTSGGFRLDGRKSWIVDGHSADRVLIVARAPGSRGEDGLSVFVVEADAPGMKRVPITTMDQTRRLAEIELSGVLVDGDARVGEIGAAAPGLRRSLALASIGLAAEQVGGAQRCLDMAVAYAKERKQFDRAIGSFQAIKHKCADMLVAVESARSALYYAACVADDGLEDLATNASLAKAWCSESYFRCASENIQIHGGVGFTWEYDPHLHFKRARASESGLGDPSDHRERIAQAIGL